ncbi:MAG: alpha/beta hydrolase [Nitrospinae bacterium]|nr:alpha/beta hydrolase [Nitrospinota bacterium]
MPNTTQTIYIVTNRNVLYSKNNKEIGFGINFNSKAPDELRLAKVTGTPKNWKIKIFPESSNKNSLGKTTSPAIPPPSEKIFIDLLKRMNKHKRNCLFFVHGFNNPIEDVVERCMRFQKKFKVEMVAFSWPADEGIVGATNYRTQKGEAKKSVNAFDRCLKKLNEYLLKHADKRCDLKFNIAFHSMGNYLLKHFMKFSEHARDTLIFDNVILMAADTNNEGHAEWVDSLQHRKRIYITINENDNALALSRMKFGKLQKARLGHYTKDLFSTKAVYLDFTHADRVGDDHSYFEGKPLNNQNVRKVFDKMFNGQTVEDQLKYDPHSGLHRVP